VGFCRIVLEVEVEVEVTLRPTVSRPVRLGVLPLLVQVIRCYIWVTITFFIFSYRVPSLTRGRVYNLQCNDVSWIFSYIGTDGLSASSSWCRVPNGAHNQILISLTVTSSSWCRAPSTISPMNRVIQPKVKVKSQRQRPEASSFTVRTSQEKHHVSATEPNRLMLFRETVAVYCENHTEHADTVRTSQKTHHVSATETNRLILFEDRCLLWEPDTLCGQNAEFLMFK
jgi:hypothetical protein